jgi:hypothetical protein
VVEEPQKTGGDRIPYHGRDAHRSTVSHFAYREIDWATMLSLLSLGMLLYTVTASPGFYAARREWAMVVMFGLLSILTKISIIAMMTA